MRELSNILRGFNFLPILNKQRCLWLVDEALAPQGVRWVGVKKRYTPYVWKPDLLTFFSVKISGLELAGAVDFVGFESPELVKS
jgi:hypothetical protein